MRETTTIDLRAEDVSETDWEALAKRLAGVDLSGTEMTEIQACGGGACCDDCFIWAG